MTIDVMMQKNAEEKSAGKQKQTFCAIDFETVEHAMSRTLGPELVAHAFWELAKNTTKNR